MKFVYTVWLKDLSLPNDDPECEWPACFIIDGATAKSAKEWGDHLVKRYTRTHNQCMIRSAAETFEQSTAPGLDTLPVIAEGKEATDDEIGW